MSERAPSSRRAATNFYASVLDRAQQLQLEAAADVDGLDDEVALLRLKLRQAVEERPEDLPLMLKGIEMLVRAVAVRYRLSPKARKDLADNLAATLEQFGRLLFPDIAGAAP